MKKIFAMLLTLALVLCGLAIAEAGENVVTYSITDDPQQMDPTLNSYSRSSVVLQNLFQGLYKLGPDGKTFIPACAESYEVSEDGLTYTFKLREGLKWSDGSPLTAKDFEYSWKRVATPETASGSASDMWVLKNGRAVTEGTMEPDALGVKAVDDLTLVVEVESYTPWFVSLTSTTIFFPVKQEVVEAETPWTKSVDTYVSNGAFMLAEYSSLDKIVMAKNPNYYGADDVQIDKVIYYIIADTTSELISYENGDLTVCDDLDSNARNKFMGTEEYVGMDRIGIQYWDFNCQLPEFSDPAVRKAFSYAIDRQAMLTACMLNVEKPEFGFIPNSQPSLTVEGSTYREVAGPIFSEDVELAKQLMADAGYPNGEGFPIVHIVCQNYDDQKLMAQIIGEMWKANLGVQYDIVTYESSTYWDELANGNFSVGRNGFTCDYMDPSANLRVWVSGSNCSENGWDDPVYDQMFAEASTILDNAEREAALIEVEKYICDQMPGMPSYTMVDDYLVKPNLKGVIKNAIGHIYFEYAHFE